MSKKIQGAAVYPLSPSQNVIMYQQKFCIHKNVAQVPFYFLTEKKIDPIIMKRAINEEIARNDSLRLRFFKEKGKLYEYFLPSLTVDAPFYRFSSQEEQDAVLQKDATKTVEYLKGDTFRIILFHRTWDGRSGVYINAHHAVLDAVGIGIFFNDLCNVYDAIENDTPMPKPLYPFEESLKRDIEAGNDREKREKDREFWKEIFHEYPFNPYYAGLEGPARLDKARAKKPEMTTTNFFNPLNENAGTEVLSIPGELMDAVRAVARENSLSPQQFIQSAMRIYLSRLNHDCGDVTFLELCSRRAKIADMRTGGCRCHAVYTRTVFDDGETYLGLARKIARRQALVYRHADLSTLDMFEEERKWTHNPVTNTSFAAMFSYIPRVSEKVDTWRRYGGGYNPGKFATPMYIIYSENNYDGSLVCRYVYREFIFKAENMVNFHNGVCKILEAAVENPEQTVGEIKKAF